MLYKMSEWEICGKWYCNCTDKLGTISAQWWFPMRLLNLSISDFVNLLLSYEAVIDSYENDLLIYHFNSYKDCHSFVLYVNRMAKKYKILI